MGYTIKDIALKLGVSTAAVSKALNGKSDVSEKKKKKVKKVAEEFGYSPNYFAKKLATNKSGIIGVFILGREELGISEHFGFRFLEGILESANKNGFDITLFSSSEERSYKKICEEKRVEGTIFIGLRSDTKFIDDIKSIEIPVVSIDYEIHGKNSVYVGSNNSNGVHKGMEYLWDLGHRNIGIVKAYKESEVGEKRFKSFKTFLKEKKYFNKDFIFEGDYTKESGYKAGIMVAELDNRPTALFCVSDLMAIGVIDGLKTKGLSVPNDISVLGFDNINAGEHITPTLSTIAQNAFRIGESAVISIIDRINGKTCKNSFEIEPRLLERESCRKI